jgi:hypothetical protein
MPLIASTQINSKDRATEYGLRLESDEYDGSVLRMYCFETPVSLPGSRWRTKPFRQGIGLINGALHVAPGDSVKIIDHNSFEYTGKISHKWMSDFYRRFLNDDGIPVTSIMSDAVISDNVEGRQFNQFRFHRPRLMPNSSRLT